MQLDPLIVDVRTPWEYAQGHLPGAVLVPTSLPPLTGDDHFRMRENLRRLLRTTPRWRPVWVYCKRGVRSALAAKILDNMGYRVTDLGGWENW